MYERHKHEQYFFDDETLQTLSESLKPFDHVCCLCAPSLGEMLENEGRKVTILDIDTRFQHLKGFRYFDIQKPEWLGDNFDLIISDPPFFNVSLSRLFAAVRLLAQNNFKQPVLLSYLQRRAGSILGSFSKFNLAETDYFPGYQTVQKCQKNDILFFSNTPIEFNHSVL